MQRLMQASTILLLLLANSGCSQRKPCPTQIYPNLHTVDRIDRGWIYWNDDGSLDTENAQKLVNKHNQCLISDGYYFNLVGDYRKEFIK